MGSKANYLESVVLNHVLGASSWTPPSSLYFALYTATPSDTGGGTEVVSTATNYARAAHTNNAANWPTIASNTKSNGTEITFNEATASWGVVGYFAILDAATAGNFLYWGDLTTSKTIDSGDTPKFAAAAITITED